MAERNTDPEAWLADQLAQLLSTPVNLEPGTILENVQRYLDPSGPGFSAIEKLAQEYGEMCAARALALIKITGMEVEVKYSANMPALPALAKLEGDKIVVRPK